MDIAGSHHSTSKWRLLHLAVISAPEAMCKGMVRTSRRKSAKAESKDQISKMRAAFWNTDS